MVRVQLVTRVQTQYVTMAQAQSMTRIKAQRLTDSCNSELALDQEAERDYGWDQDLVCVSGEVRLNLVSQVGLVCGYLGAVDNSEQNRRKPALQDRSDS